MPPIGPEPLLHDLVLANRILANEGVLDAFGHVSVRHPTEPDRFLISRSLSPELVEVGDLQLLDASGARVGGSDRATYAEVAIHAGVYRHRGDVMAVVHSHSPAVIPFGVTGVPLRPVFHVASAMGSEVPVFDIAQRSGDSDLLVRTPAQGDALAETLGPRRVALMRGHGCVVAMGDLRSAVFTAVYLERNAMLVLQARQLGEVRYLSAGEIERASATILSEMSRDRAWEFWTRRLPKR